MFPLRYQADEKVVIITRSEVENMITDVLSRPIMRKNRSVRAFALG